MIYIKNIKKTYNEKLILDVKDLAFSENNIYAIIGENGSGKSTLAKIIAGIVKTDDNINVYDIFTSQLEDKNINRSNLIGYLSQKPYIFDMSLEKNILININKSGDKNKLNQLISDFKIDYLKSKNAKKFSGGEKQKLSLARFMIREYKISIFDEVTSAMDTNSIRIAENNILKYFNNEYDAEGITNKIIIVITHDIEQAKRLTNNILIVKNKNIVTYE